MLLGQRGLPLSRELEAPDAEIRVSESISGANCVIVRLAGRSPIDLYLDPTRGFLPLLVQSTAALRIPVVEAGTVVGHLTRTDQGVFVKSVEEVEPGVFLPTCVESDGGPAVDGFGWTLKSWDHSALRAATHPAGLFDGVGQLRDASRPGVVVRFDDGEVWETSENFLDALSGHQWPRPWWLRAPAFAAYAALVVAAVSFVIRRRRVRSGRAERRS
jgi:hypothetical protein